MTAVLKNALRLVVRSRSEAALVIAASCFLLTPICWAQSNLKGEGLCLYSPAHVNEATVADTALANKTFVRALAIYVAFPDQPSRQLPAVSARLETELPKFIRSMSEGRQTLVVETALRPAPFDSLCYVADSAMSYYQNKIPEPLPKTKGFEYITEEILDKVQGDHPNFHEQYEVIFLNIQGNFQRGSDGLSLLVKGKSWERKYQGLGATIDLTDAEVFLGVVAHEYGHLLGAQHPPHFLEKSFGDYELMDQHLHRLAPFSLQNLLDIGWIAPERVQVVNDTVYNVELDDVRCGGKVLLLAMNSEQYFLAANHQGSDYDSVYKGKGLLVWHQMGKTAERKAYNVWDLESAAGLSREGRPDPIAGQDDFDRSRDSTGTAADFFNPSNNARFGAETNPNSNFYDELTNVYAWRVQTRPSGIALTNLRQHERKIILDVLVPRQPPQILEVRGPNDYVDPVSYYGVDVWLVNGNVEYVVEVWYRYAGAEQFERAQIQRLSEAHFSGEIPLRRVATQVQYYVRVVYGEGFTERFPASADSLLSFIIKPRLSEMVRLEQQEATLVAGDSILVPLRFDNTSTFPLQIQSATLQHESVRDDRAYDSTAAAQQVFVPRIFFNAETESNFGLYFEYTPSLYFRLPSLGVAVAKAHLTYDEKWVYLYLVLLMPRTINNAALTFEFIWRDSSFQQEVWVTAVGATLTPLARPVAPVAAIFLSDASGSLPKILLKLSASALRRSSPARNLELRARFWSDRYPRANWPNVVLPNRFGKIIWQEDSPEFELSSLADLLSVGEKRMRMVKFYAPRSPWAAELTSWLLVKTLVPTEGKIFFPLSLKIKNYRSRLDSTGGSPSGGNVLDPKPNWGEQQSVPLPTDFKFMGSFPNPFQASAEKLRVRFFLPRAASLDIIICDVLGRRVAELARDEFVAGEHEVFWEGKDREGKSVQRGIYFIRFSTSTSNAIAKIVIM